MRRALPFLLILALAGCKGGRESEFVGTWTSATGIRYVLNANKTYTVAVRTISQKGEWSAEGDKATLRLTTINGEPVGVVKAQLEKTAASLPANLRKVSDEIGKPMTFTLGADGKTMTKDGAAGVPFTLTKT